MPRFHRILAAVCVATGLACSGDDTLSPIPRASEPRVLTHVSLSPASTLLYPGDSVALGAVARDQSGYPMVPDAITYTSSDPAVAAVSSSGMVTALAIGAVTVSATATIGGSSRTGVVILAVREHDDPATGEVRLVFGVHGWEPSVVHVDAGTLVQWVASGASWAGTPTHTLWLLNEGNDWEALDLSSGSATRTFGTPGTFLYCAGGCWDPPDYGVIHVH